jgi:addiction module HigA family antidote
VALTAIHPGEHLGEELEALYMSTAELARKIDVLTNRITQILNGRRSITGDTACASLIFSARVLSFDEST